MMLHRIVYWNAHLFYRRIENQKRADLYFDKAEKSVEEKHQLWRYRFYEEPITDMNFTFLGQLPFHVDFLTHWHFSVDNGLENFQS